MSAVAGDAGEQTLIGIGIIRFMKGLGSPTPVRLRR